jgi:hypothetical protein
MRAPSLAVFEKKTINPAAKTTVASPQRQSNIAARLAGRRIPGFFF